MWADLYDGLERVGCMKFNMHNLVDVTPIHSLKNTKKNKAETIAYIGTKILRVPVYGLAAFRNNL